MEKTLKGILYNPDNKYFLPINNFLAAVTLISVAGIVLETVESLHQYQFVFIIIEYTTVFLFTVEYFGRIMAHQKKPLKYIFSFFGLIDLLAIVPSYLGATNLTYLKSTRMVRILRFLRILRVAKLARLTQKQTDTLEEENFFQSYKFRIYIFTLLTSIVIFGSLMHIAEGSREQFTNIPTAMIWSAKVILGGVPQTVPLTTFGELVTIGARFMGLLLFGLLITVIGTGMQHFLFGRKKRLK